MPSWARAYEGRAAAWAAGPARIYEALDRVLVSYGSTPLRGALALDVGAGTGGASRAMAGHGARVVAADAALDMLRRDASRRPPAVASDILALPFRNGTFDVAVAAFVVTHVTEPEQAFAEVGRILRRGGVLLASAFDRRSGHPAKQQVEDVLRRYGWSSPDWYTSMKRSSEDQLGTAESLARAAAGGGFAAIDVETREVDVGAADPVSLAAWRLGMPHAAGFVDDLDASDRERLWEQAVEAVGNEPQPYRPVVSFLRAERPA